MNGIGMSEEYEGERFVLFSYFYLPVITKELATGESLISRFGCIPNGEVFDDRMAKAVKINKRNKRRLIDEGENPDVMSLFPDMDREYAKTLRFEEVGRSW